MFNILLVVDSSLVYWVVATSLFNFGSTKIHEFDQHKSSNWRQMSDKRVWWMECSLESSNTQLRLTDALQTYMYPSGSYFKHSCRLQFCLAPEYGIGFSNETQTIGISSFCVGLSFPWSVLLVLEILFVSFVVLVNYFRMSSLFTIIFCPLMYSFVDAMGDHHCMRFSSTIKSVMIAIHQSENR